VSYRIEKYRRGGISEQEIPAPPYFNFCQISDFFTNVLSCGKMEDHIIQIAQTEYNSKSVGFR